MTNSGETVVVATASHNPEVLAENLARSPSIVDRILALHVEHGAPSASVAYNRTLDATTADIVVFAHHDVWLPRGWERLLATQLAALSVTDPSWAVVGAFGIGLNGVGYGPVWSTSLSQIVGRVALAPVAVQSLDECLIVLRRASGLRFDEGLPNFHLYGTDIVQAARALGLGAWALPLPLIHNDVYKDHLGNDFAAPFHVIRRKWRGVLPIRTPVTTIAWHGLHLIRDKWRTVHSRTYRKAMAAPTVSDPARWAALCGWSDLEPSATS